jgi:hypothetical protein
MIRIASFAVAVSLLSLVDPAHAELLSPPLWTDVGNAGACYVRNIGTTPFQVKVKLFSNNAPDGTIIDVDTCNTGPLGAGKTCLLFSLHLPDASWAACSVKASNSNVSQLRGNIDIRHFVTGGGAKVVVGEDVR